MRFELQQERMVAERFPRDVAEHVVTERHRDGLYGHWRCNKPGTWNMGFDIVTWPGTLCISGDMGHYVFQRTADMIAFMRGSAMSFGYAAEKCVAHDGRIREWRVEIWEEYLAERLKELGKDYPDKKAEYADKIEECRRNYYGMYETEHDAIRAMYESGLWDSADLPTCKTFTWHFLWCLYAIAWFVQELDAGRVVSQAAVTV